MTEGTGDSVQLTPLTVQDMVSKAIKAVMNFSRQIMKAVDNKLSEAQTTDPNPTEKRDADLLIRPSSGSSTLPKTDVCLTSGRGIN